MWKLLFVIVHKKLSIAVVYTKVNLNISLIVAYFKSAIKKFWFQVFIKTLSHEKHKYTSCQMLKWLKSLKLQWYRLKSSITTLYTSVVICNGVCLTKLHTKVVFCNSAKKSLQLKYCN